MTALATGVNFQAPPFAHSPLALSSRFANVAAEVTDLPHG
jgi:hypothetical protein